MKTFYFLSVPFVACVACLLIGCVISFMFPELGADTLGARFLCGLVVLAVVPPVWALFAEVNRTGRANGQSFE